MKKNIFWILASALSIIALPLVSCNSNKADTDDEDSRREGLYVFENYKACSLYEVEDEFLGPDEKATLTISVDIMMPQKIDGENVKTLRDTILSKSIGVKDTENIRRAIDDWQGGDEFSEYYKLKKIPEVENFSDMDAWELTVTGRVVQFDDKYMLYVISAYEYLGGAHGLGRKNYINYDVPSQKILTISDFITPEGQKALPEILKRNALLNDPTLEGMLWLEDLPSSGNFFLDGGLITFVYDEYEAGPYSLGFVQASVGRWEIRDYLTPFAIKYFDMD